MLEVLKSLEQLKNEWVDSAQAYAQWSESYNDAWAPVQAKIDALTAEFEQTNAELIKNKKAAREKVEADDSSLRAVIIDTYMANPKTKQLGHGLSVRVNTVMSVDDKAAINWLLEHKLDGYLKLDLAKFKKLAAVQDFDFVKTSEKVVAVVKV